MKDFLMRLGLTNNEAKTYLCLLKHGEQKSGGIIAKTNIVSSQVYLCLSSLVDKGLVTYKKTPKVKIYEAVNPQQFKEILSQKQKLLEQKLPALKLLQADHGSTTKTSVYEGLNGFKAALHNMVRSWPKGAQAQIIGFSAQAYKSKRLAAILRDVNKMSKRKKHKFRMILDHKQNPFVKTREQEGITTIRYMENGFVSPAAINICEDSVSILMWDETPYVFSINNKNIAIGFRNYFEFLWSIAK